MDKKLLLKPEVWAEVEVGGPCPLPPAAGAPVFPHSPHSSSACECPPVEKISNGAIFSNHRHAKMSDISVLLKSYLIVKQWTRSGVAKLLFSRAKFQ